LLGPSLRLTAALAALTLATTRLGLIAHELVGHAGVALACGGHVSGAKLFWFAGGWVTYHLDAPSVPRALAIAMAGIAVEFVAGIALWLALRRGASVGARLVRAIGAALVGHAGWYLATGAWHGFGDGALLYQVLGDARAAVAIPAAIVTCGAAYAGARCAFGAIVGAARPLGVAIALVVVAGMNVGLAAGELALRRDATYVATMAPERDRAVARDLARWQAEQRRRNIVIDEAAAEHERARLAAEHRDFPFAYLLAAATLGAVAIGARRSPRGDGPPPNAFVARAALVAAIALAAVIALSLALS
jgi:hypothetical protein